MRGDPLEYAVEALAVARIARLITTDRFPFGALRHRIIERSWAAQRSGVILLGEPGEDQPPYLAELLTCPWCMSVWVALGVLLLRRVPGWPILARVLAASYVTGFLAER